MHAVLCDIPQLTLTPKDSRGEVGNFVIFTVSHIEYITQIYVNVEPELNTNRAFYILFITFIFYLFDIDWRFTAY